MCAVDSSAGAQYGVSAAGQRIRDDTVAPLHEVVCLLHRKHGSNHRVQQLHVVVARDTVVRADFLAKLLGALFAGLFVGAPREGGSVQGNLSGSMSGLLARVRAIHVFSSRWADSLCARWVRAHTFWQGSRSLALVGWVACILPSGSCRYSSVVRVDQATRTHPLRNREGRGRGIDVRRGGWVTGRGRERRAVRVEALQEELGHRGGVRRLSNNSTL